MQTQGLDNKFNAFLTWFELKEPYVGVNQLREKILLLAEFERLTDQLTS